jgi:hypothetical protein
MPKYCVSIFTENERIINSHTFNHPSLEELEKEIQKMLFELTFNKPLAVNKEAGGMLVQEMSRDNIKWLHFTFEKKSKTIKYFVIIEPYKYK